MLNCCNFCCDALKSRHRTLKKELHFFNVYLPKKVDTDIADNLQKMATFSAFWVPFQQAASTRRRTNAVASCFWAQFQRHGLTKTTNAATFGFHSSGLNATWQRMQSPAAFGFHTSGRPQRVDVNKSAIFCCVALKSRYRTLKKVANAMF
jgi:hypothetical protein